MYKKVDRGLLLDSTSTPKYSEAVEFGDGDCAMFEAWLLCTSGTVGTVTVTLEASPDGKFWDDTPSKDDTAITDTLTAVPEYGASTSTALNPGFRQVRLRYELAGSSTPKAMIDAAIRTYDRD